uniref:Peroxiredoxin-like 2A n=1 Tax=Crocodylus porosus TaxID=8502 RepID=A0A7M4FXK9_CROPO
PRSQTHALLIPRSRSAFPRQGRAGQAPRGHALDSRQAGPGWVYAHSCTALTAAGEELRRPFLPSSCNRGRCSDYAAWRGGAAGARLGSAPGLAGWAAARPPRGRGGARAPHVRSCPGCWRRAAPAAAAEASELSSLKPQLDQLGVPLYAVVKEKIGSEVEDFQHYFKGEIFLDEKKKFYGPHKRKMLFMGLIRIGVWQNFLRAWKNGFSGNLEGEGVILGGVYVMGAGKQGVLLEHREREFGDKVSLPSVLEAVEKIKPQAS